MRDEDGARARIARWAKHNGWSEARGRIGHIGVRRVPDGWLGWVTAEPTADPAAGDGDRVVLRDDNDWVDQWPAWPVAEIVHRLEEAGPDDRFPPVVRAQLEVAGWFLGRRLPDEVLDGFAREVAAVPGQEPQLVLHSAARVALAEFGGLSLEVGHRPTVSLAPVPGHSWVAEDVDVVDEAYQQRVAPVGLLGDPFNGELVMAEDGWVLVCRDGDFWQGGETFDRMLVHLVRHNGALVEVDWPD
jgi:hypothetical protein